MASRCRMWVWACLAEGTSVTTSSFGACPADDSGLRLGSVIGFWSRMARPWRIGQLGADPLAGLCLRTEYFAVAACGPHVGGLAGPLVLYRRSWLLTAGRDAEPCPRARSIRGVRSAKCATHAGHWCSFTFEETVLDLWEETT